MISTYRVHATLSALCVLLYSISSGASAASLGGHCSNWMTSGLNDQTSGAADVNATRVACTALSQSGDFETRYEPRTNTCLICNRDDWTASVSGAGPDTTGRGANYYRTANAAISGHNLKHLTRAGVQDCMAACDREPWCKSFDYYKGKQKCDLSDKNASEVGGLKTNYPGNPYDHYAKDDWTASVSGGGCSAFHGDWGWKTGDPIDIHPNGNFLRGGTVRGSWSCSGNRITLDWNKGYIDVLTLSVDGKQMRGRGHRKGGSSTHVVAGWR